MNKKRILSILICIIMVAAILASCAPAASPTPAPGAGTGAGEARTGRTPIDKIIIVTETEPDTLDPRRGNSVFNNLVMNNIYDSLIDIDQYHNPIPRLATSWEWVDDTNLRLNLRQGVVFSNGAPFTARDVFFSFERGLHDPTSLSTMIWFDPENTVIEDDYTIVIAMHNPHAPIWYVMSGGRTWIGNEDTINQMGEDSHARAPIGTGPYVLEEWVSGSHVTLVRNDNYWGEPAATERLQIKFVSEPANRLIELETGAAHVNLFVAGADVTRVENIPGFRIVRGLSPRYYFVTMAMTHELLQDRRVRYALSYAVDKNALVHTAFDGAATVLNGVIPINTEHFVDFGEWVYDPDRARALMAEAGFADGFDIELHILPGGEWPRLAQIFQAYWAEIGVRANIEVSPLGTREGQGPWEIALRHGNVAEVSSILIVYEIAFGSRIAANDVYLDDLLQEIRRTLDPDRRRELLIYVQEYIWDMRWTIPFAQVDTIFGVHDGLSYMNFSPTPWRQNFREWVIYE